MKFERVFTVQCDDILWNKRDAKIQSDKGISVFEMQDVEAPSTWSDNAVNIVASKYFKKINGKMETSVKQLIARVVDTIVEWGKELGYFTTDEDAKIFSEEITYLVAHQYACFNSPIWFNFGVPGRPHQAHACFLLGLDDDTDSITRWMSIESKIFKGGSGSGINLSPLRYKNAPLSAGGVASGPMSFAKAADCNAGVWKSGGTTRRAATLRRMDVDHHDIIEFITCKAEEEKKAQALIAAGYDGSIDGSAYSTVAFQNMNHSVGVSDNFMRQVVNGDPVANSIVDLMAKCAWEAGDPGIQYDDCINRWNTIPKSGRITTSNPCGEYLSTDWSACLLSSFNLLKFRTESDGLVGFDFSRFSSAVRLFTTALDIIISKADYPDIRFEAVSHDQRQMGLGYSNLGGLLMSMGIAYSSEEGRELAAEITSIMTSEAYIQSSHIAKELGPFADYERNKEDMLTVMEAHRYKARDLFGKKHHTISSWNTAINQGKEHGYRNAVTTLLAPTGTISFMMDCDTTGIESELALVKYKKLVGGGNMVLVNNTVVTALTVLGYSTDSIKTILNHIEQRGTVEGCEELLEKHLSVFDCALKPAQGNRFIHYNDHLRMVAAVQPFLSMGISKTINMPNSATIEDIKEVLINGWRLGIKSVSIYRDGSKQSQPLNVGKSTTVIIEEITKPVNARRPLPDERPSITHKFVVAGFESYLHVGLYDDGMPGEIFIDSSKCGSTISGLLDAFATSISYNLQYMVPLETLVEKFTNTRFEPAGFTNNSEIRLTTSIVDYIFQWMRSKFLDHRVHTNGHIKEDVSLIKAITIEPSGNITIHTGEICAVCGSMLQRTGTCLSCAACGAAGGCG